MITRLLTAGTALLCLMGPVQAEPLEIVHWWASPGEAPAVAALQKALDDSGDEWVDQRIMGGLSVARPIVLSRILGGDPMAATQMLGGRQARELAKAGYFLDITDVAEKEGWRNIIEPTSILDDCTFDGKVYCVPVNIQSWQWIWLSNKAFEDAGLPVPQNWDEFVAAGPKLKEKGIVPLVMGKPSPEIFGAFNVIAAATAGVDTWKAIFVDHSAEAVMSPEGTKAFQAFATARELAGGQTTDTWIEAAKMVVDDKAAGHIIGDWAQTEYLAAGEVAGKDYTCLPGLGMNAVVSSGGNFFYFPAQEDPEITAGQKRLAALLATKEVQFSFNHAKGSLPIRGDVDISEASDCMKKGMEILKTGVVLPNTNAVIPFDKVVALEDLAGDFWNEPQMTAEQFQTKFAELIVDKK